MKKTHLVLVFGFLFSCALFAKDYQAELMKHLQKNDFTSAEKCLKEWQKKDKKNSKIDLAYFNYYVQKAYSSPITDGFAVITLKDGTRTTKEMKIPNPEFVTDAIKYIDRFIEKNPNRLDAYTGKREVLMETKFYDDVFSSAKKMLETSKINNNQWYWENGLYNNGADALAYELEQTVLGFFKVQTNTSNNYFEQIVTEWQNYYPEDATANEYSGVHCVIKKDFQNAIKYFEKSYSIKPTYSSLQYLANIYEKEFNDNAKAIEYYEKMNIFNDPAIKNIAAKNMERLKGHSLKLEN